MSIHREASTLLNRSSSKHAINVSGLNIFSPSSTSSSAVFQRTGKRGSISAEHNRRLLHEIVDNIFNEKRGVWEVSSSRCSSVQMKPSVYSLDRRLNYWRNVLEERRQIAEFIKRRTGKEKSAVLFNRQTTVDDRNKQTVKRLMDYAERMEPLVLRNRQEARLEAYEDPCTKQLVNELRETLPLAEREGGTFVEITGLPPASLKEQLGRRQEQGEPSKSHWLNSEVLEQRIEERHTNIERVVEYYPDIEGLQIVGESITTAQLPKHNPDIRLLQEEQISEISSESSQLSDEACRELPPYEEVVEVSVDYAMRINEQVFQLVTTRSSKHVERDVRFECEPFERLVKRVFYLENLGSKVLNCEWVVRPFYEKTPLLLKSCDDEFVFDRHPFRLIPGESRDIIVLYQPRKVDTVKEKWNLRINPNFFCRRTDAIVLKLHGCCRPSTEYVDKVREVQRLVIEKSNMKMMHRLTTGIASLTPLVQPPEVICPYKRTLNEAELFEFYNIGYKCDRYHDLELLKEIYGRVKKPREPAWDLRVETLKTIIMRQDSADRRALIFGEMMAVLEQMKGQAIELDAKILENPESERTRFLFVRGSIIAAIDDWEELTGIVEEVFLTPAIEEYYVALDAAEEGEQGDEEEDAQRLLLPREETEVREYVLKHVRSRKTFRDSLYMHTYTLLCNFIEDLVSIMESTDII